MVRQPVIILLMKPFSSHWQVAENVLLKAWNTFGLEAVARYYYAATTEAAAMAVMKEARAAGLPVLVLGGGSNLLFAADWEGLVLHMRTGGRWVVAETEDEVLIEAAAGENWHALVMWTVAQGWGGIENLALIPGTAGAAPIQNIGAYGVELKDVLDEVRVWIAGKGVVPLKNEDCAFDYRDSIFKQMPRGDFLVLAIRLRLKKQAAPNLSYYALKQYFEEKGIASPSVAEVAQAVIDIRRSKLPDPAQIGNAGSFFKNPVVERVLFERLRAQYPSMPFFEVNERQVKIPAAWLIEQCGWKGKRRGAVGVHERQALVLVHYGGGTGAELWQLAKDIQKDVAARFGICLQPEVNVLGGG